MLACLEMNLCLQVTKLCTLDHAKVMSDQACSCSYCNIPMFDGTEYGSSGVDFSELPQGLIMQLSVCVRSTGMDHIEVTVHLEISSRDSGLVLDDTLICDAV